MPTVSRSDSLELRVGHPHMRFESFVGICMAEDITTLIYRLRKRAEIRRQIPGRKSVKENKPDRIADLLEEAASRLEELEAKQT